MTNLIKFLELAEKTLKRHKAGSYSYQSEDCDFCIEHADRWDCGECPLHLNTKQWCSVMKTYKTDLRPEYWVNVVDYVKTLIKVKSTDNPKEPRDKLSEALWQIDSELSE